MRAYIGSVVQSRGMYFLMLRDVII